MALMQSLRSSRNTRSFGIRTMMQPLKAALLISLVVGFLHIDKSSADIDNTFGKSHFTCGNDEKVVDSATNKNLTKFPTQDNFIGTGGCKELILKLNSSRNLTTVTQYQNDNNKFILGNISLSFASVSLFIEENGVCKNLAEKKLSTGVTCGLKINLTDLLRTENRILSAEQFPVELMKECLYIKALSLSGNCIQELHNNLFNCFQSLEVLDLSSNKLTELNLIEAPLHNLTKLRLSRNKLQFLQSSPFKVSFLYLDHNDLDNITFLSSFPNLTILDISNNRISSVPSDIVKHLKLLTCIFLKNNKISDISFLPYVSKDIYRVTLSNNAIREVNIDLTQHKKLNVLELNDNEISSLNFSSFANNIYTLNICNNNISTASPFDGILREKSQLKTLIVCNNSFTNAQFLTNLDQLKRLDLSNNNFDNVAEILENMKFREDLKVLELRNVNLDSLDFVKKLGKLEKLYVDNNKLKNLSKYLFNMECIKELGISNNPLDTFYCSDYEPGRNILQYCEIPITTRMGKIVLDLGRNNKNVNKDIKCFLNSKNRNGWNDFVDSCAFSSESNVNAICNIVVIILLTVLKLTQ